MSKSRRTPSRRLTCTDVRFIEVDFPRQLRPRLVIEFSDGLSILLEDQAAIPLAAEFIATFRKHLAAKRRPPVLNLTSAALKVFLALDPCDMRKSFNGLHTLASDQLQTAPARDALFVFTNKRRNRIKLLYFDGTGLWVAAKRLEKGRFSWPAPSEPGQRRIKLAPEALQLLIDGVDLRGAAFKHWVRATGITCGNPTCQPLAGTLFATKPIVENGTPPDIQSLLLRFDAMEKEIAFLKSELARKDKIIAGLQQRLFGSSSEKLDPAQLQFELEELLLGKPVPPPDPSGETSVPEEGKSNAARTRRTKAERFPTNLKILVEGIIVPEEVLANPADWSEIGEENHDELDVIKAEIFWRRTIRKKFVHKADKTRPPVIAPAPLPSIPGTLLAPALAAQIITDKYQDHLPHYRQSQRFRRRHHIHIGRQTLNTWTHATARHLGPIDRAIRAELLQAGQLEIDETPIDYQDPGHGSVKEGRLWAYRDPVARTCYFDWHAGRGTNCLLEMLGYDEPTNTIAFTGTIHSDGYSVYDAVAAKHGLRHAGCLAHIRRKFTDLGKASPEVTLPVLRFIQRLYQIEKQTRLAAAPPACRELIRRARSRPIADELHRFILTHLKTHLPASNVGQALGYTLNQWPKFLHCLEQGVLEIDTNLVENMIRPTKLGMKNWMFFGSLEAGSNNALIYTLLANCRAHDLDPEDYLVEVIKRLPSNSTPEQAAALTPARIADERRAKAAESAA